MKSYWRLAYSFFVGLVFVWLGVGTVQAQGVEDFIIKQFRADYALTNDHPQGLLKVKETIELDFSGQNRGILRAIPTKYGSADTKPSVASVSRNGSPEPFITFVENDNLIVRIGEVNTYISGEHRYVIEYSVRNVIRFYDTHDELYWDVNGTQWRQPFSQVLSVLEYSSQLSDNQELKPRCFTGRLGDSSSDCSVTEATSRITTATDRTLLPGETLTTVVAFNKGYFTPPTFIERHWTNFVGAAVVAGQLAVLYAAFQKWRKFGRDHSRGVVSPYFERPKNVSVLEACYIASQRLEPKHLTATFVDLAIRGYVQIVESDERTPQHTLILKKEADEHLQPEEQYLLTQLFAPNATVGAEVRLEDKKHTFHPTLLKLQKMVDSSTHAKGYFDLRPSKAHASLVMYYLLAVLGIVVGFITAPASYGVGVVVGIVVFVLIIVLGSAMGKRSSSGMYLKEHMDGLKLYLSFSEKRRIAAHDAVAAPLAARTKEPARTVAFFEKLLPFAVALGAEKTWAHSFRDIYIQPPNWYSGNWSTFNTAVLARSLSKTTQATAVSFSSPSSSSGSGFSGGSAGGGGGGGGGGGW